MWWDTINYTYISSFSSTTSLINYITEEQDKIIYMLEKKINSSYVSNRQVHTNQ